MEKFLRQVANYYGQKINEGVDLGKYTFVFPNKRAAMFMRKYLKEIFPSTGFMPRMITITSFTQEYSNSPIGSNLELTFLLYRAYCAVLKDYHREDQTKDFDTFLFWGQVLLNDFNDIDSYLVDEVQLFKNIKAEREIASNYLTKEQIEVARILGEKYIEEDVPDQFWKHVSHDDSKDNAATKFIRLWEMLHDIYVKFQELLGKRGISYSGMQSREAYYAIKEMAKEDFHDKKYAFIGFYVLPTSRMMIFKKLKNLGISDFFWDTASPLLHQGGNKASNLIMPLAKEFPSPADFSLQEITFDDMANIEVMAVSSNIGQTKVAAKILHEWGLEDEEQDKDTLSKEISGIVLPNEKLLSPLLYSLPEAITRLNVAMRLNFSSTPFASVISSILQMHVDSRVIRGEYCLFYKDVLTVLSQPYISSISPDKCMELREKIMREHLYNVSSSEIKEICPKLSSIFAPLPDGMNKVKKFLEDIIETLSQYIQETLNADPQRIHTVASYEMAILQAYTQAINEIYELAQNHDVGMKSSTFLTLLRKLLYTSHLQLNGDPVSGLQILGLQDARVLDFDNLLILSLNERILPKKNFTPSLVPLPLRQAYGMPTPEAEEITLAYQFYRLISRASRICLLYDSRTPDESSGEISRYLQQLKVLMPEKIHFLSAQIGMKPFSNRNLEVIKDENVMKELQELMPPGNLNFSASSFKTFIKCPLRFYLQNVKKLYCENIDLDYMDASSFGQILHKVAQLFYEELRGAGKNVLVRTSDLKEKLNDKRLFSHLTKLALDEMNKSYYYGKYPDLSTIPGEGRVLAKVIATYLKYMIEYESEGQDFTFISGEDNGGKKVHSWNIDGSGNRVINFTMSIDRIDQLDGKTLRFIDYKTGDDNNVASDLDELFTVPKCGGIFQLMLYSLAYGDLVLKEKGTDMSIKPMLYRMQKIKKNKLPNLKIGDEEVLDYKPFRDDFRERLIETVELIFDPSVPFSQTPDIENCKFCPYTSLCGRIDLNDNE